MCARSQLMEVWLQGMDIPHHHMSLPLSAPRIAWPSNRPDGWSAVERLDHATIYDERRSIDVRRSLRAQKDGWPCELARGCPLTRRCPSFDVSFEGAVLLQTLRQIRPYITWLERIHADAAPAQLSGQRLG